MFLVIIFTVVIIFVFSVRQRTIRPPIFNVFSEDYGLFRYLKQCLVYVLVSLMVRKEHKKRNKNPSSELIMDDIFQLSDDEFAQSSIAFNCSDDLGNIFVGRICRRVNGVAEIWMSLHLSDGTVLFHPAYPVSNADDFTTECCQPEAHVHTMSAAGLTVEFEIPLKLLRFTYKGPMRVAKINGKNTDLTDLILTSSKNEFSSVEVEIRLWYRGFTDPDEALKSDLSPEAAALVLANSPWHLTSLKQSKSSNKFYRANLQQGGALFGTLSVGSSISELRLFGLRTRTIGVRDWSTFNGYATHCGRINNGTVISVGILSQSNGFSHALSGFILLPDGKVFPVDWSDFHLAKLPGMHYPGENLPARYEIAFKAGGKIYTLIVTRLVSLPMGHGKCSSDVLVHQNLVKFELNGILGYGSVEYQHGPMLEKHKSVVLLKKSNLLKSEPNMMSWNISEAMKELDSPLIGDSQIPFAYKAIANYISPLSATLSLDRASKGLEKSILGLERRHCFPHALLNSNCKVYLSPKIVFPLKRKVRLTKVNKKFLDVQFSADQLWLELQNVLLPSLENEWQTDTHFTDNSCFPFHLLVELCHTLETSCNYSSLSQAIAQLRSKCGNSLNLLVDFIIDLSTMPSFELELFPVNAWARSEVELSIASVCHAAVSKNILVRTPTTPIFTRRSCIMGKISKKVSELPQVLLNEGKITKDQANLFYFLRSDELNFIINKQTHEEKIWEKAEMRCSVYQSLCFAKPQLIIPKNIDFKIVGHSIGAKKQSNNSLLVQVDQNDSLSRVEFGTVLVARCLDQSLFKFLHTFPIISGIIVENEWDHTEMELFAEPLLKLIKQYDLICLSGCSQVTEIPNFCSVFVDGTMGELMIH